jgi:type II restriction enzyme
MEKLTASNIISFIKQLDKRVSYNYVNNRNKGQIQIVGVDLPEGPIRIKRWDSSKGETSTNAKIEPISPELIWRIANAFQPNVPINFDRVLGGSYNTRSVLEALLVHTPEFYYCYPGRIEVKGGNPTIQKGHKHVIWKPELPHEPGIKKESQSNIVISEIPTTSAVYEALVMPEAKPEDSIDINIQRRHAQIQFALYFIGKQLNYRTWVANNDKGILYQNKKLGEYEGVILSLRDEKILSAFGEAAAAALLIDCMWFKNGSLMPAVMEIEHSTGVTSGLTRMKNFKDNFIVNFPTRYVVVAPDEDRDKVIKEANKIQFKDLNTRFFPYSAVEELYALCTKRKLKGITEEFLDCYMESILAN